MTVKLKLVGAERYMCHLIGPDVVEHGGIVTVDDKTAELLQQDVRVDGLNNEHPVWEEIEREDEEGAVVAPKSTAKTRAARAATPAKKATGKAATSNDGDEDGDK